jgi:hypothetical protein
MRRVLALTIALLAVPAAPASAVDPLEGVWASDDSGRHIEITPATTSPLQGHTVRNGPGTCGDRDVDLRLSPQEPSRYTGPGALYAVRGGVCAERIEDAFVEIVLGRNDNVAAVTYTPPPSAPSCSDCTQVWTRISAPPGTPGGEPPTPPRCSPRVMRGTPADDSLLGTIANESILGRGGNDRIGGAGGDDCVYGGTGNDRVLDGGSGSDRVYGGRGADLLAGGVGNDFLFAGTGGDVSRGGAGNDVIEDARHVATAYGQSGNDWITLSGPGIAYGGGGADTFDTANRLSNSVHCGPGVDHALTDRIDARHNCEHVTFARPAAR